MSKVVVTSAGSQAGQAALRELIAHGHKRGDVDGLPSARPLGRFLKACGFQRANSAAPI